MTWELDAILLAIIFLLWAVAGFLPWLVAALIRRGRGVLVALPLAVVGGAAGGVIVPAAGARNEVGILLSVCTAFLGGLALSQVGFRLSRRLRL